MRTLVLGDIHGAAKALEQCGERSGFDPDNDLLIQLGDVTDGYPDVYDCVEMLLKVKNLIAIKGNHDDWFLEFISTDFHPQYWSQGGLGTLKSYLDHVGKANMFRETSCGYKTALVSSDIPVTHRNFFTHQRLFHIDDRNRCFVHGGFQLGVLFDQQRPQEFFRNRSLWDNAYQHKLLMSGDAVAPVPDFSEVYLGHTPTINWGTDQPLNAFNIWNLDTGAGHSGRLTIMDVDTKQYWRSDPLPELYKENFR